VDLMILVLNIYCMHIQYKLCIFKLFSNLSCVIDLFPIVLVLELLSPWLRIKTGNINDVNNYRGVTLSPVISKLLEVVLLSLCSGCFRNRFFYKLVLKTRLVTLMPFFTLNSTIEHFVDRGSSVYISSLAKRSIEQVIIKCASLF